jgi:hypothetical protein
MDLAAAIYRNTMLAHSLLSICTFAVLAAAQSTTPPAAPPAPVRHLVLIRTTGPAQMQQLLAMDLDLAACRTPLLAERSIEAIVDDQQLAQLGNRGFGVQVLQRDLSGYYAAQAALFPRPPEDQAIPALGQGSLGGHWTLAEMEAILDNLHAQNPTICSAKVSIGSTIENRSLWMVKISDNVGIDEGEPEVLFDAMHHAREPLSMEATLVFMEWLVTNYGSDPEATFLVNERELYFVPCLNPDGYEYNRTTSPGGGGLWRKNRRDNGDGTFGVDLNRNYATGWSAPNGGSSAVTSSETYRGAAPFSEPETAAIEAFAQSRQFVTVFSTHTYQDVLLRPWGWQLGNPANAADYDTLGSYYVQENGIQHGSTSALLYIASGSAVDHHHTVRGAYGWTAELGRSNEGGFWPSGPAITNIVMRHQPMFQKIAATAGPKFTFGAVSVAEGPGGNGNGTIEAGETGAVSVTIHNMGLAPAPATLQLLSNTAGVTIGIGLQPLGSVASLGANATTIPLTFLVAPGLGAAVAQLRLVVGGDGHATEYPFAVDLLPRRLVVRDDFEQDRGFARAPGGTATTGLWERATPQATNNGGVPIQPGVQTTPNGSLCWVTDARAGTSVGQYDVDGGFTDLESPELDLSHLLTAEARWQLWYAESTSDDAMSIDISRDGGANWLPAYTRSTSTGTWTAITIDLGSPLTAHMKLRVHAQDLVPSLVECLVDDFEIYGQVPDGSLTILASGSPGSTVQVVMHAPTGSLCFPLTAPFSAPGLTYPGITGTLLVDPGTALVLPFVLADSSGRAVTEVALPSGPWFAGIVFHWQLAMFGPTGAAFGGNATSLTLQ